MRGNTANGPKKLTDWQAIDWKKANVIVNNLRRRIFRAVKEGNYKKARSLQKLMLRSHSNILLSVRRVTQTNLGKKTPGIDKKVALTPNERMKIIEELTGYTPWKTKPVRRIYIPKASNSKKKRPLGIPTIINRCHQAIVKNALEPEWESKFEGSSYGFRPGRSPHDAIGRVYQICKPNNKKKWILDADLRGAFDKVSHQNILAMIKNFPARELIKQWLQAGYIENDQLFPTESGVPQGGVISPLIFNISTHGMEKALGVRYNYNGRSVGERIIVKFADDFVCFTETEKDAHNCKRILQEWLKEKGLEFSEEKTSIVHISEGFDFLGFNIRQYKDNRTRTGWKLLIKPSKKSIKKIKIKLKEVWKSVKGWNVSHVIKKLNPIIRGWANYHRIVVSKDIFSSLDHWMFLKQKNWANHTHRNKMSGWKQEKYWGSLNIKYPKDRWVFGDKRKGGFLLKFSWFPIERHWMVKGTASPDDSSLNEYWNKRKKGQTKLLLPSKYKIACRQDHKCPICGDHLINGEELEVDHIIPGQGDKYSNLQLLHFYCHQQKTMKQRKQ